MSKKNSKNKDEFVFLPLGGSGEIGMNLNLFGFGPAHKRQWIIIDIGVTFGNAETPGIDIIMPDIAFLEQGDGELLGVVLTHAHEDHMGALARLWPKLKCPVYATPFTMYLVRDRLAEVGLLGEVDLHEVDLKSRFNIGPFDLEMVTLTHSIPEPNAVAIRTPAGLVLHTGDWKIDADPQIGEPVDAAALKALGEEGILAMICDSTNVFSPGFAGSEAGVRKELTKLISEYDGRGVAVASFASNVARLESVMMAARENNRSVCLVGRSMHRMVGAAKAIGLLDGVGALLDETEAMSMPQGNVLYLCTGSQGEPRAALSRIAAGDHRNIKFSKGDVVIFSSKIMIEHAKLARELGVKKAIAPHNGEMILIGENGPQVIDIVPSGRLHQDGNVIVSSMDDGLRLRRKMAYAGHIAISLVVNSKGRLLSGPDCHISGFPHGKNDVYLDAMIDDVGDVAEEAFNGLSKNGKIDEDVIEDRVRSRVRKLVKQQTGKRPVVVVSAHKVK